MNTNVYLVRHAHSIFTPDEQRRPLSEQGKQDAELVAQILNEEKIDIIISSPYARAVETVEEVAMYHQLPIILVDGFKERKLAVQPVADFEAAMDQLWHNEEFAFQGGESNKEAQNIDGLQRHYGASCRDLSADRVGNVFRTGRAAAVWRIWRIACLYENIF
jgi:2,3-bisphosphoglycerate-dependent phosphoglycerate mutase